MPKDLTYDFFQQQFMKRKNDEKKKKENTLAALIRTAQADVRAHEADAKPGGIAAGGPPKPLLTFKTLFDIETAEYLDDASQFLAVGMVNGGTIVYDVSLGVEVNSALQCHGGPVTSIAFYGDKIITGSKRGTVYISSMDETEEDEALKFSQSNCQDENIPIAKVLSTDYGIGLALDVRGNIRLYDMIRYKKIAKVHDRKPKDELELLASKLKDFEMKSAFRIFPNICLDTNNEQIIIVDNSEVYNAPKDEDQPKEAEKQEEAPKGGKGKAAPDPAELEPVEVIPDKTITDFEIQKSNTYIYDRNEIRQSMRSRDELHQQMDESTYCVVSKSSV